jgi:AcrR family transcriptional regulator
MTVETGSTRPKRLTRAEAKARTRTLLLDSAAEVFAHKGFAGASVEEIAESAGFSIGALYSNFGSKEQLFLELLGTRSTHQVVAAARALEGASRTEDGPSLRGLGELLAKSADEDLVFASLQAEFWLYAVRNPEAMSTLVDQLRESHEVLEKLIDNALKQRGVHPSESVKPVATVAFALIQGLVQQRRIDAEAVPEELFEQALMWLFRGYVSSMMG